MLDARGRPYSHDRAVSSRCQSEPDYPFGSETAGTRFDFQTAIAAGLPGVNDPEVLARAAREGRILVTHDRKAMPRHFATFITEATSAGGLIVPQHLPVAAVVDDLLLIWYATEAEEWINQIRSLPL